MTTDTMTLEPLVPFDARRPEVREDPYPLYRRLREEDPVHRGAVGEWVITTYADVATVLGDPRFSNDLTSTEMQRARIAAIGAEAAEFDSGLSMISMDPPDHTRLRRLVQKAFTPRAVEVLRPRIEEIVEGLLDPVEAAGSMDLIADFAFPFPIIVICELLGVPISDRALFHRLTAAMLDDTSFATDDAAAMQKSFGARMEMQRYMGELVARRRREPTDDLMGALVKVEQEGDQLSERELVETGMLLLIAGHVTTSNLIGNGMLALLRHPEELRRLREDPALGRSAVEELLRYDGPVHAISRAALEDVELHGRTIRAGDLVMAQIGAANRDPARFPDPERLDLGRRDNRHVAFGRGIHFCLGAPLARVEGEIAIAALLRRFPEMALATDRPRWTGSFLRGLEELPLTVAR